MKKTITTSLIAVAAALALASLSVAKNENEKANNNAVSKSKSEKVKELKDFEKPASGKTNAAIHKEKTDVISAELLEIAEFEKNKGQQNKEQKTERTRNEINNPNVGQQERVREEETMVSEEVIAEELEEIAVETEEVSDETVEAIGKAEKQNKFKKFLVGTDYKNLGQLRSSLVQNRNQIRKLTSLSDGTEDGEIKIAIQEQLTTMMQERERIKAVIAKNEEGFSLLGWVFRFMNGYPEDSIDELEENELEKEVVDAMEENIQDETTTDQNQTEETEETELIHRKQ